MATPNGVAGVPLMVLVMLSATLPHCVVGLPPTPHAEMLQPQKACDCTAALQGTAVPPWCYCGNDGTQLADKVKTLQDTVEAERQARKVAEAREVAAIQAANELQNEIALRNAEVEVQTAKDAADAKARKDFGNKLQAETLQAAQAAQIEANAKYSHQIALESATEIATAATEAERKQANETILMAANELVEKVADSSAYIATETLKATTSSAMAAEALKSASASDEIAREQGLQAAIASAGVVAAQEHADELEARAKASEDEAARLEASAVEDRRQVEEAYNLYSAAQEDKATAAERQSTVELQVQERLENLTSKVVSQALLDVKQANADYQKVKARAEEGASARAGAFKLLAYRGPSPWDEGGCKDIQQDNNMEWCKDNDFKCKPEVEVSESVCASKKALLVKTEGTGDPKAPIMVDNCEYAYYAQYECMGKALAHLTSITGPPVVASVALPPLTAVIPANHVETTPGDAVPP